jgi:2,5-diamino-6-(ribosylamino)-4(3H)-pyrimidinone 5'-phosphate reductase
VTCRLSITTPVAITCTESQDARIPVSNISKLIELNKDSETMSNLLRFASSDAEKLEPHLPPICGESEREQGSLPASLTGQGRPFTTLTFATSLDSSLALAPGTRTLLSGPESKAMTHYLRSRHDTICVGAGTVIADDPGLNCRLEGANGELVKQPRPVIIDPNGRWDFNEDSKVFKAAKSGHGLAPFIVMSTHAAPPAADRVTLLEKYGGKFVFLDWNNDTKSSQPEADGNGLTTRFRWSDILAALYAEGLRSIMIEGGGQVINSLLEPACRGLVDSVIVTIAPTWLGQGGVVVSPARIHGGDGVAVPAARLQNVAWHPFGEDIVLCGRLCQ